MDRVLTTGQVYHGFLLKDIAEISDYNGKGYWFQHQKTGLEVYHLATPNKECFFTYTVYTPPENDTGVFHILEHTLLTGSRKYPVRDPFMSMARNSCNTFLNAMTGPDRTDYPAASPVKKDFDNIFSVYTDAVFEPLLRKESFMQEGIRLVSEGGIHFEGVVFSEMQGDISSHNSVVQSTSSRYLFDEDSPYRHEFGGEPAAICDLTYEAFLDTYRRFYCPRNITLFLYGDLDVLEKLEYLDEEYLKDRDGGERQPRPEVTKPWEKPAFASAKSNAEDGDNSSSIMVSWLLGDVSDPTANTELALLVDVLLGNPGCPLYRRIVESGIGRDISDESGMADYYRDLAFGVGFCGSEEGKAQEAEAAILRFLREIVAEGLNPRLVEACLRRMEFRLQEIPDGVPEGYRIYFSRVDKGWAYGRNPSDMLQVGAAIKDLRRKLQENPRYLEEWIEKKLLWNNHRLLSVVTMDKDNQGLLEKAIEEKTLLLKGDFDPAAEERFLAFEEEEDSEEAIALLPRLSLDDIPNEFSTLRRKVEGNILSLPIDTHGIVYADMAFDISDLTMEELEYASLLSRLLLMTNVGELSYSDFLTELRFITGASASNVESGTTTSEKEKDFFIFRFKSLKEHFGEALDLVSRLFGEGDFSDKDRILAAMRDIQSDFENSVVRQASSYAIGLASQYLTGALYTAERTQGITFWYRIKELVDGDLEKVGAKLEALAEKIFTSARLYFHVTADEGRMEECLSLVRAFQEGLPEGEKGGVEPRAIPEGTHPLAYTLSSPVSYTAAAGKAPSSEEKEYAPMSMLLSLVSRNDLWALIREKGGAYGAGCGIDSSEETFYFYTYRDPRLDGSVEDFGKAVAEAELDDESLEDAKLKVLSRDVKPKGPQVKGLLDFKRYLYEVSDEMRKRTKRNLLAVSIEDMESVREEVCHMVKGAQLATIASQKAVASSALGFETKALPFC